MNRHNRSPSAGSTIVNTLKPYEGGTGQTTAIAALTAMDVVPLSTVNQPNGVAGLDPAGKLFSANLPIDKMSVVSVEGATSVVISTISTYKINNFDIATTYDVQAVAGASVSRSGDTITFTAPGAVGVSGFTINGRRINITVEAQKPDAPTLSVVDVVGSPATFAAAQCTGSAFSISGSSNTHASSDWQVARDSGFTIISSQSMTDATNKTTWKSGNLNLSTTYYVRVRYRDNTGGVSNWSNTIVITTKAKYTIDTEEAKLVASDSAGTARFWYRVAMSIDGTRVAIAAPWQTSNGLSEAGQVYVFRRTGTTWTTEQILYASDRGANYYFSMGMSMSSDGTRMVAGNNNGKIYVFVRNTSTNVWTQEQTMTASDVGTNGGNVGRSASMNSDGSRIVAGAWDATSGGLTTAGQVYVYTRNTSTNVWTQEAILSASDKATGDAFGASVCISADGTRAVVGAYASNTTNNTGKAYVFVRSGTTWTQEALFKPTITQSYNWFSFSITINADGTRVAVGAQGENEGGFSGSGRVYIYSRSGTTWTPEAIISNPDKGNSANFGYGVSISNDGSMLAIGASQAKGTGNLTTGKVYILSRNGVTWNIDNSMSPSDAGYNQYGFGAAVAMSGDGTRIVGGATLNSPGSAYVLR